MKFIDLVYFNAGGGYRSAALALDTVIRELGLPWQVRLVVPGSQPGAAECTPM